MVKHQRSLLAFVSLCLASLATLTGVNLWGMARSSVAVEDCRKLAAAGVLWNAEAHGWEVRCVANVRGLLRHPPAGLRVRAVTSEEQRVIYLQVGTENLRGVLAHEEGHAWAVDNLDEAERSEFSSLVGSPGWRLGGYFLEGNEVWARGFTHCQGMTDGAEGAVPACDVAGDFLKRHR